MFRLGTSDKTKQRDMTVFKLTRPTIYHAPQGLNLDEFENFVPDSACRRYLSFSLDFDARATMLSQKIDEKWDSYHPA